MDKEQNTFEVWQRESQAIRRMVIEMVYRAGSGHCGGSLSCAEILVVLYRGLLDYRVDEPGWEERDRFILSKGHAAPSLYAMLARVGFISEDLLWTLRRLGSALQGHPDMRKVPGVEISTGSLGMGISNGIGTAWVGRYRGRDWKTFVVVGDGELDEGQNWEAAMLAEKLALSNLVVIVDYNGVQLDGTTDAIMPLGDLKAKFQAFGWSVTQCDGHDCRSVYEAVQQAVRMDGPAVVLARTVKGKGVSFMEGNYQWHGAPLSEANYQQAMKELKS
jgi:transketolase